MAPQICEKVVSLPPSLPPAPHTSPLHTFPPHLQVTMENKEFENQLKARRKAFGESLEGYAAEVEGYHEKNDMVRRDQVRAGRVWGGGLCRRGGGAP